MGGPGHARVCIEMPTLLEWYLGCRLITTQNALGRFLYHRRSCKRCCRSSHPAEFGLVEGSVSAALMQIDIVAQVVWTLAMF